MALRPVNVLSLCAGVGGLELGIRIAEPRARGVAYVEREAAAAASLVASMEAGWLHPAPLWSDVGTFDARPWRGVVHCVASGDPCQPNSVAGKRLGDADDRFLIDQLIRIVDECRPYRVFRENVPGNAHGQLRALAPALERLGYRVASGIFSAEEVGASHRRERLFIMADAIGLGEAGWQSASGEAAGGWPFGQSGGSSGALANASDARSPRAGRDAQSCGTVEQFGHGSREALADPEGERPREARGFRRDGPEERAPGCGDDVGDTASARHSPGQSRARGEIWDGGGRAQSDRRSRAVDDAQCAQRRQDGEPCDAAGPNAGQRQGGEGPTRLGASGPNLAEPDHADAQGRRGRADTEGRQEPSGHAGLGSGTVVDAESLGRGEGRAEPEFRGGRDTLADASRSIRSRRLFAPGPTDPFWAEVCRDAPTLEPAVCRVAHGLAGRIERLRAVGNGVCPLAAAYAWRSLDALLATERTRSGQFLVRAA